MDLGVQQHRVMPPGRSVRNGLIALLLILLLGYLLVFFLLPVGSLLVQGLRDSRGDLGGEFVGLLLANPLYAEGLINSLVAGAGAAVLAGALALPVAGVLWRGNVRPSPFLELCGFLPLFVPPFVLAASLQAVLGRGGGLGHLLRDVLDIDPAQAGLLSLIVVEAVHYFPFVLMTLILTTADSGRQAREAASLGTGWGRLVRRVFLPLAMPGLAFGMALTFLKVLDDLATPLALGVTNMLAPQAYYRVTTYGAQDPLASLIAVALFMVSALAWFASLGLVRQHALFTPGDTDRLLPEARKTRVGSILLAVLLVVYATCYAGVLLTSLSGLWSHTTLPESYVGTHYQRALFEESGSLYNTLMYCGLAALIDLAVGLLLAHALAQAAPVWKRRLTWLVAGLLSVPGVALAIAYLQFFRDVHVPFTNLPLDATGFLLTMAFSVRGLPFALRACGIALASVPVSHIEAARTLGCSWSRVVLRIVLPMMSFGLIVAFILCLGVSAVDLSSVMLLVPSENRAPLAYAIYLHLQSRTGLGTGSALAILALGFAALALFILALLVRGRGSVAGMRRLLFGGSSSS